MAEMMMTMLMLSIVLAASMPILTKRTSTTQSSAVPYGAIVIWHGTTASIPTGWHLCDGTGGTPDLRSRFVYGAGADGSTKASWYSGWSGAAGNGTPPVAPGGDFPPLWHGGEEQHVLATGEMPAHNHTASSDSQGNHTHTGSTSNPGDHVHQESADVMGGSGGYSFGATGSSTPLNTGAAGAHTHTLTINASGAHTHTITVNNNGSGTAHNIMPRFMVLAYIMKV